MLSFLDMRTRSLALFDALLLLVIGLTGLVVLVTGIQAVTDDRIADLTIGLPDDAVRAGLPDAVALDEATAVVAAEVALGWRLLWWAVGAAAAGVVIAAAEVLRQVVASAREGDPFVAANVRRLRIVGVLAMVHGLLSAARIGVEFALQDHLDVERISAGATFYELTIAIVVFAVAEIWQRGVEMRDEQTLTV
jgi:hypothetical protein